MTKTEERNVRFEVWLDALIAVLEGSNVLGRGIVGEVNEKVVAIKEDDNEVVLDSSC